MPSMTRLSIATVLVLAVGLGPLPAWSQARQVEHAGPGWIIDPAANCGTSNPFSTGRETISWSAKCLRGRIHGPGTLIWFENGIETERDEGTFRSGELHGDAVVKLANKTIVFGNYKDGVRHGEFMVVAPEGSYVQSVYAEGELLAQKRLGRDEIKAWREARKGDQRVATLLVERPAREADAPTPALASRTLGAEPRPVDPLLVPTATVARPIVLPLAVESAPPSPAEVAPGPLAVAIPKTAVTSVSAQSAAGFTPSFQRTSFETSFARVVAAPIPGGINLVGVEATLNAEAFSETRIINQILNAVPPQPLPLLDYTGSMPEFRPLNPASEPAVRAGAPRLPAKLVQGSGPASRVGVIPLNSEPIRLRAPRAANDPSPALGFTRLSDAVPIAAEPPVPSAPMAGTADTSEEQRLAINLAGADIRDATKLILGDVLKLRFSIDADVTGKVNIGAPSNLPTSLLLPWLRDALHANTADLVATPDGYRVYALATAIAAPNTLPTLAPPAQAESLFVRGRTLEREGRDIEAVQAYSELARRYAGAALAQIATERLSAINTRAATPRREVGLAGASMLGAYLCSKQGYYPNQAKWCGFVRSEDDDAVEVEVRELTYNGLLAIGFRANACTGGEFIGPTAHGKSVFVPRSCVEARW